MPNLIYNASRFILSCKFDERMIAKENGFFWDPDAKCWYTKDLAVAARLRDFAVGAAKSKLNQLLLKRSSWTLLLPPLPPAYSLLAHQKAAILFALERNRSYLGLDPGLGKTLCAATVSAALKLPTVYISPPFLTRNVAEEFKRFQPHLHVKLFGASPAETADVLIVPDSIITRELVLDAITNFVGERSALLIIDEAHRFKNSDAKRTQALFGFNKLPGIAPLFDRQIFMSGTPMPNRPVELFPVLTRAAPETIDFMSYFQYGLKFCAGHQGDHGWDFSGASNVAELARRVIAPTGPFMLRLKKDLLDLPPKLEEIFTITGDLSAEVLGFEKVLTSRFRDVEDIVKHRLAQSVGGAAEDLHVATYRRLLGLEKAPATAEYVETILEETDESLILFAYHREVIDELSLRLSSYRPLVITGQTPMGERHDAVKTFQGSSAHRLIIGNYTAMGTGFTLTKATRVVFCEFDWVPGVNDQASDRAHRIGQKSSVLVQYVVYANSLDGKVLETLLRKRRITDHI